MNKFVISYSIPPSNDVPGQFLGITAHRNDEPCRMLFGKVEDWDMKSVQDFARTINKFLGWKVSE